METVCLGNLLFFEPLDLSENLDVLLEALGNSGSAIMLVAIVIGFCLQWVEFV